MVTQVPLFILGMIGLIKGADWFVDGSSSIAKKLGVSALLIGLTVVAFGTSAPELVVNLIAGWNGAGDVALGNINGSNIANILLILGISSLLTKRIQVKRSTVQREIPIVIAASAVLALMVWGKSDLSMSDGGILLLGFLGFLLYLYRMAKKDRSILEIGGSDVEEVSGGTSVVLIVVGLTSLIVGGILTVNAATHIAETLGISGGLIGLTIVAFGTSLPELVTSAVAAKKGETDLLVGGVVGSNVFNILLVIGLTAVVSGGSIVTSTAELTDAVVALFAAVLLLSVLYLSKTKHKTAHELTKLIGMMLIGSYVAYLVFIVLRG